MSINVQQFPTLLTESGEPLSKFETERYVVNATANINTDINKLSRKFFLVLIGILSVFGCYSLGSTYMEQYEQIPKWVFFAYAGLILVSATHLAFKLKKLQDSIIVLIRHKNALQEHYWDASHNNQENGVDPQVDLTVPNEQSIERTATTYLPKFWLTGTPLAHQDIEKSKRQFSDLFESGFHQLKNRQIRIVAAYITATCLPAIAVTMPFIAEQLDAYAAENWFAFLVRGLVRFFALSIVIAAPIVLLLMSMKYHSKREYRVNRLYNEMANYRPLNKEELALLVESVSRYLAPRQYLERALELRKYILIGEKNHLLKLCDESYKSSKS